VEKFGIVGQAIDDNIIRSLACRITKVTGTHSEYVILIAFSLDSGYANESRCYTYIASFINLQNNIHQLYQIIGVTAAYSTGTVSTSGYLSCVT